MEKLWALCTKIGKDRNAICKEAGRERDKEWAGRDLKNASAKGRVINGCAENRRKRGDESSNKKNKEYVGKEISSAWDKESV